MANNIPILVLGINTDILPSAQWEFCGPNHRIKHPQIIGMRKGCIPNLKCYPQNLALNAYLEFLLIYRCTLHDQKTTTLYFYSVAEQ